MVRLFLKEHHNSGRTSRKAHKHVLLFLIVLMASACLQAEKIMPVQSISGTINFIPEPAVDIDNDITGLEYNWYGFSQEGKSHVLVQRDSESDIFIDKLSLPSYERVASIKVDASQEILGSQLFNNDQESIIVYKDKLEVYDSVLKVANSIPYPSEILSSGSINNAAISPDGSFVIVENALWQKETNEWHVNENWGGPCQEIVMQRDVAVISSGHCYGMVASLWLIPYHSPNEAKYFTIGNKASAKVSPDGKYIFIHKQGGFAKSTIIDSESGKNIAKWKLKSQPIINWKANRLFHKDGDNQWSLYQINPKKLIKRVKIDINTIDDTYMIDEHSLLITADRETSTVTIMDVFNGDILKEHSFINSNTSPVSFMSEPYPIYSQEPFTFLLATGDNEIQPYKLDIK